MRVGAMAVLAALLGCLSSASAATSFTGTTVGVADGDTLTVLAGQEPVRVRLAEIDAPEKAQAFGVAAKQALSNLCYRRPTVVHVSDHDAYGRTVGRVVCNGIDANRAQVRAGMAWVYDRYVKDRTLYDLQSEARAARRGLWAQPDAEPPWQWRRAAAGR